MTISYVLVTITAALLPELLVLGILAFSVLNRQPLLPEILVPRVQATAQQYAHTISNEVKGATLDSHTSIALGDHRLKAIPKETITEKLQIVVPYVNTLYPADQPVTFALLITPNERIFASSYPRRYPVGAPASQLLPRNTQLIANALKGVSGPHTDMTPTGGTVSAVQTVWNKSHQPIGAVYIQTPFVENGYPNLFGIVLSLVGGGIALVMSSMLLLIVIAPIGALFGFITTRKLIQRLRNLVTATTLFANGNYAQRVAVTHNDEVSQLEQQFNRMAEQLAVSTAKRQELAEQNARLAERSRISRELHDAISQDLFSLRMLAGGLQTAVPKDSPLSPQITTLEQTTTNMIREMRALLLELRPTQLEHGSLAETLECLAATYSTRLGITVTTHISPVSLPAKEEDTLLRIAQETLANAARHSNATTITLCLVPRGSTIEFTVTDNGKGFRSDEQKAQHGLGLRLMQERVHELHGTFMLQSEPCQGTQISVSIPHTSGANA